MIVESNELDRLRKIEISRCKSTSLSWYFEIAETVVVKRLPFSPLVVHSLPVPTISICFRKRRDSARSSILEL